MINTTIKIVSSDGKHSSEETVIVQSAGDMDMEQDVESHKGACVSMLNSVEHAVEVTLERIQDQIDDEKPKAEDQELAQKQKEEQE